MLHDDKFINTNPAIQQHTFKLNQNFPNSKRPLLIYKNVCLLGKQKEKRPSRCKRFLIKIIRKISEVMAFIVFIIIIAMRMNVWLLLPAKPG